MMQAWADYLDGLRTSGLIGNGDRANLSKWSDRFRPRSGRSALSANSSKAAASRGEPVIQPAAPRTLSPSFLYPLGPLRFLVDAFVAGPITHEVAGSPTPPGAPELYEMHLDPRRLVHSKDPVVVEVALLNASILERDLTLECEVRSHVPCPSAVRGIHRDLHAELQVNRPWLFRIHMRLLGHFGASVAG